MKKLCIFDFDGTLFDSIEDVVICYNEALKIHNFPTLARDEYIPCLGGNIDDITSLVLNENSTPENIEKVKKTYLNIYNPSKKEKTIPYPNVYKFLQKLQDKNILIAINSNRLSYSLEYLSKKYFPKINFVDIQGHDEVNPSKPHPYGVYEIIKKADVNLDETVYIGDSKTDIKTAQNAGIDCIIVKWGYGNKNDWENDYILACVNTLSEINSYL